MFLEEVPSLIGSMVLCPLTNWSIVRADYRPFRFN